MLDISLLGHLDYGGFLKAGSPFYGNGLPVYIACSIITCNHFGVLHFRMWADGTNSREPLRPCVSLNGVWRARNAPQVWPTMTL